MIIHSQQSNGESWDNVGTMSVPRKTPCPTQKDCKWGYLVFHRKRLAPKVLPWQQYSRCHFVSFVMYISGAKFEECCSNISGDILNSVFYRFSGTIYDVIIFLICVIQKRKKIFQKRKCHSSLLWKAFQITSNCFLLHRHFKRKKLEFVTSFVFNLYVYIKN